MACPGRDAVGADRDGLLGANTPAELFGPLSTRRSSSLLTEGEVGGSVGAVGGNVAGCPSSGTPVRGRFKIDRSRPSSSSAGGPPSAGVNCSGAGYFPPGNCPGAPFVAGANCSWLAGALVAVRPRDTPGANSGSPTGGERLGREVAPTGVSERYFEAVRRDDSWAGKIVTKQPRPRTAATMPLILRDIIHS